MAASIILVFILGYLTIVLEHPLKLDKTVPALLMAAVCWALLAVGFNNGAFAVIDSHESIFDLANHGVEAAGAHGAHG